MLRSLILVGCGGFLGSISRYLIALASLKFFPPTLFPWGTFIVNIVGCFFIGVFATLFAENDTLKFLAITGFLGGFTTFSAFGLETQKLLHSEEIFIGISYVLLSIILGVVFAWFGHYLVAK